MPLREAKEQLAHIGRLPKLYARVKKLEQNAALPPPPEPTET
jgi:hypothetical protein